MNNSICMLFTVSRVERLICSGGGVRLSIISSPGKTLLLLPVGDETRLLKTVAGSILGLNPSCVEFAGPLQVLQLLLEFCVGAYVRV